jgi:hypothetical protein
MSPFAYFAAIVCSLACWCDTSLIQPSRSHTIEVVLEEAIPNWIGTSERFAQNDSTD